jgi:hypothetical protein
VAGSEERPGPDADTVRETLRERDGEIQSDRPAAEELDEEPAHEPDDE